MSDKRWRAIQEIFWEARARSGAEREHYLASAGARDNALLEEVRRMLAADADSGILDRPSPVIASLGPDPTKPPPNTVGPYLLREEIGRGAMGIVYRAYDPRLRRDVALKFLNATSGDDHAARARFVDEARAASALDHPHNCPVYDIGTADDGRLYIAMAFCSRGSLAARLADGPISIDDAVRIATEVADALDAAHRAGVVHRDIKPGNIAFNERGDARVLDFGIAVFGDEWAAPRIAAGTPAHMAPEQVRGESVDRRTDIWAVGVVLYEMLTGHRPFTGPDRRTIHRAILEDDPDDPRRWRSDIPAPLADAVMRALAKQPADRFGTARELADALATAQAHAPRAATRRRRLAAIVGSASVGVVVVALAASLVYERAGGETPGATVDRRAVAVFPFRVRGETSLDYLGEGMADLIAAKLTGEGGLRAADPRAVYGALRRSGITTDVLAADSAVALAGRLGAGHALLGDVVGTSSSIVVNASLIDARRRVVSRASTQGQHDDLSALIDRLVARLLSETAGEEPQRLALLTSTSLPALRAYLEGQAAYRGGKYADAIEKYARALDFDSTFALAALGMSFADGWVGVGYPRERGRRLAWQHRQRLSARDRTLLLAHVGPTYPRPSTIREQLGATEEALRLAPDRVELWYELGDIHFHWGRIIGGPDWERRAEDALRRAVELDSAFAPPMHHLVALYARQRRRDDLRAVATATLAAEPDGATADYVRWRAALARGDSSVVRPGTLDSLATETIGWIAMNAVDDGVAIAFGRRAAEIRAARPGNREQRFERALSRYAAALNAGRPREALALLASLRDVQPDSAFDLRLLVLSGLYGDGDRAAAERAAATLPTLATSDSVGRELNRCVAEQWRLHNAGVSSVGGAPIPADGAPTDGAPSALDICRATIEAMRARLGNDPNIGRFIGRLDRFVRAGPVSFYVGDGHTEYASIAVARLLEASGNPRGALEAIRRRPYFIGWQPFLAASLREEARLAVAAGDAASAVAALEHHLALRTDPDPALRDSTMVLRADLVRLRAGAR